MTKYERALYYYDGNVIGRIENFEPEKWFGHVTLFGMEEFAEYGTLDFDATVETADGKFWSCPESIKNPELRE